MTGFRVLTLRVLKILEVNQNIALYEMLQDTLAQLKRFGIMITPIWNVKLEVDRENRCAEFKVLAAS